ncbi:MAG: flavodoxin [Candidatus Accumulibacter sp.]|jgi:flavodoxin|nr:flavodoxin [Accumulibacter sp.]
MCGGSHEKARFVADVAGQFILIPHGIKKPGPIVNGESHMKTTRRNFVFSMLSGAAIIGGASLSDEAIAAQSSRGKALVLYYSWSGNTKIIATQISQKVGGDMVELDLVKPYSRNYNTCTDEAKRDQEQNARPELKTTLPNLAQYDVIYLGYPIWWGSIPMHFYTLLEQNDFSGKTIAPFCSHGGGGIGRSVSDIKRLSPNATVTEGLSVPRAGGSSLSSDIDGWLSKIGLRG